MTVLSEDTFEQLIAGRDVQKQLLRTRRLTYVLRDVSRKEMPTDLDEGWYVWNNKLKYKVRLAKDKPKDVVFEDEIWAFLSIMGFKFLSKDRSCSIPYGANTSSTQQIDVLAVDDESAIIVECKCADSDVPIKATFKTQIESLGGKIPGLFGSIRKIFGKPDLKIALVLATKNYTVSKKDLDRLESFGVRHFSEADIEYYTDLVAHLGTAARFQFQADLFPNQDIPEIEHKVYAIRGKMGGHTYYSFSIEPTKLLKLAYVLHRSKSVKLLPTYQRLIKKSRLNQIKKFVDEGGYFPNCLIVNIDSGGKKLRFDVGAATAKKNIAKPGVLHLPAKYRSIYVIDGQHRLYAYSDSDYSESNSIPVVAFVDLNRTEQLRLFMEINQNQKKVSTNLRHTLEADLKWDSPNLRDRAVGLKTQLAQDLGEDISSPLYNRVLVGEDQRTEIKIISLEAILKGLNRTNFIGKFTKDEIREQGIFNTGDSQKTLKVLKCLLFSYFDYFSDEFKDEWSKTQKEGAILTVNDGITSLLMIFNDVVNHMVQRNVITPLKNTPEEIVENASHYLIGMKSFFDNLDAVERAELRTKYGSGAPTRLWRIFQREIKEYRDDFEPEGLEEYWIDQSNIFNVETYERIAAIEKGLKKEVRQALENEHGNMWLKKGMKGDLYTYLSTEAAKKNVKIMNEADEKSPWDCLNLIHYREIMLTKGQWSNLFQNRFTIPGQERLPAREKTKWLVKINEIRNNADHDYSVTKDQADYVAAIHDWRLKDDSVKIQQINAQDKPVE